MTESTSLGARAPDHDHLRWLAAYGLESCADQTILDVGCGSGFLCQEFMRRGAKKAVGVDLATPDVPPKAWVFLRQDLEDRTWPERVKTESDQTGFDLITAFDILEHLSSPVAFLSACLTLLNPNGKVVITTPNTNSWERLLKPQGWSGAMDVQHRILFNRYSLEFLLRRVGFAPTVMKAPLRKLSFLGAMTPDIGAQIIAVAGKA